MNRFSYIFSTTSFPEFIKRVYPLLIFDRILIVEPIYIICGGERCVKSHWSGQDIPL